jgi:tRNA pseudouridine13 synthase
MSREEAPPGSYSIRTRCEDFIVVEEPLYPLSGEGTHTFMHVEKRGRTTEQVARELASAAGVLPKEVGYAGRKDRHALTRQWFSLPDVDPARALEFELRDARVLESVRHGHKLKTGHLRANRFEVILRGQRDGGLHEAQARAAELLRRGMPNRYGSQRFGRDGDNADRARAMLASGRPPRDRRAARFLISALQSEVFNALLEERAERHDEVELGDLARVEESGGLFWVDDLDREAPRAAAFEISATGPIFGTRMRVPRGEAWQRELRVFERFGVPEPARLRLPRGIRARGTRRPLRVRPVDLEVAELDGDVGLRVSCALPSGSYMTVLLESLVGPVADASGAERSPDEAELRGVSSAESESRAANSALDHGGAAVGLDGDEDA